MNIVRKIDDLDMDVIASLPEDTLLFLKHFLEEIGPIHWDIHEYVSYQVFEPQNLMISCRNSVGRKTFARRGCTLEETLEEFVQGIRESRQENGFVVFVRLTSSGDREILFDPDNLIALPCTPD